MIISFQIGLMYITNDIHVIFYTRPIANDVQLCNSYIDQYIPHNIEE